MILLLEAASHGHAQAPNPPPLSPNKALYYMAWQRYLAALPKRPAGNPVARPQPAAPAFGGTWSAVTVAPTGVQWQQIGDAPSAVLANGSFLLGSCCGRPSVAALFDPVTLGWTSTAGPNLSDFQAESSYELLPDG